MFEFRILPNTNLIEKYFFTLHCAILFIVAFTIICFSNVKFETLLTFGKVINFEMKDINSIYI